MSITTQHIQEVLGDAYVRAVIGRAGYNIFKPDHDYSCDGIIRDVVVIKNRRRDSNISINYQLKSSYDVSIEDGYIVYDLESKAYNDLVASNTVYPYILVLFVMPKDETQWLEITDEALVLRHCAWWCSFAGLPETDNQYSIRVKIPIEQRFTPESLKDMMEKVKGGKPL